MEFRVLGPTERWSAGQQCELGPGRVRAVLAILLLSPRAIVSAGALIDRLGCRAPPKAMQRLSAYIARLRASLRQAFGARKPHAARIVFKQALDIFERLGVPEAESARIRLEATSS